MAISGDLIAHDVSELPPEDFKRYVELVKINTPESIAAANSIWPNARAHAKDVAEFLALIAAVPTAGERLKIHTKIDAAEERLVDLREHIEALQREQFQLESERDRLKNSPVIQKTGPLHGSLQFRLIQSTVLRAAVTPELKAAGLIP